MNLQDKKTLAEFMEWTVNHDVLPEYYITKDGLIHWAVANYDPTVHPEQFKELLEHLTPAHNSDLAEIEWLDELYEEQETFSIVHDFIWISDHMPEVIQAIIQVIKVPVK